LLLFLLTLPLSTLTLLLSLRSLGALVAMA